MFNLILMHVNGLVGLAYNFILNLSLNRIRNINGLQGDAGGLAVGYVDLDFQVPPVCPLALPIQP